MSRVYYFDGCDPPIGVGRYTCEVCGRDSFAPGPNPWRIVIGRAFCAIHLADASTALHEAGVPDIGSDVPGGGAI
jgi:hypothetical protein